MKRNTLFIALLLLWCIANNICAERRPVRTAPQVTVKIASVIQTDDLSNVEHLLGYWFVPHSATINIRFYRDKTFAFNDYNSILSKDEKLQGTYQLSKGKLTLLYTDRPKQTFTFYKGNKGDNNYYIKKTGYYFVKGENGDSN